MTSEDRLVAAYANRSINAYANRSINLLVLDGSLRPYATAVGLPDALASALHAQGSDLECMREILG